METAQENISQLLEKYGDMVMRIAYTYLKNKADAEDIVQDVFVKIMTHPPAFKDENHQKAWLFRVTKNQCLNALNKRKRNIYSLDKVTPPAAYDEYTAESAVLTAVQSLPEKYRIVVYMYYYEGYATEEIARLLAKNHATVRSLLRRARAQLKDLLKEEYDFD